MTFSGQQPVRPQADWLQQLTDIRQLMAEQAAELDRSGDFPHHNLAHLHQRGFLSLATPAQYGGRGRIWPGCSRRLPPLRGENRRRR